MTDFLFFLGKLNLVIAATIILVCLIRKPFRVHFGASIAYAIWLLVPLACLAILVPPRVATVPSANVAPMQITFAPTSFMARIEHSAQDIRQRLAGRPGHQNVVQGERPIKKSAPVSSARATTAHFGLPDYATLLFIAWFLGAMLMALYLIRLQARFLTAVRLGQAGPAVMGTFRPRVVLPDTFHNDFNASEQAAILAHEDVHLMRQDARINALIALLRCLCWFNPLIHFGAKWLRTDQELACDAAVVAGPTSKRDYANALVKSQMLMTELPLGCNWPGSQHPLVDRIAMLKQKAPGKGRRITGACLILFVGTSAGVGAWAAQPPISAGASQISSRIALAATPSVVSVLPMQDGANAAPSASIGDGIQTSGEVAQPTHRESRPLSGQNLVVPTPDISQLMPASPELVASNEAISPPAEIAPNAPAVASKEITPVASQSAKLLATSEAFCADRQVNPSDPHYLACLDIYLGGHSANLIAKPLADGSLEAVPTPTFPHSTFHAVQGFGGVGGICLPLQKASPAEFNKCLDQVFASQCGGHASGSYELQMLGACDWKAERGTKPPKAAILSAITPVALAPDNQSLAAQMPVQSAAAQNCAPPELVNSVRMEKVNGGPVMSVAATIDGAPETMLIDIGRMATELWETPANKLHLGHQGAQFFDYSGRFSQRSARIESFKFGNMEGGGFHVMVAPDPDTASAPFDGIIGNNVMWQYDVDLDFAHQKLNFFTPEKCEGAGIYWSPSTVSSVPIVSYNGLEYADRSPLARLGVTFVPVVLDGKTIVALLDTRSDKTFLNPDVAQKLFGLSPDGMEATDIDDGGTLIKAGTHIFSRLSLGGLAAGNVRIAIPLDHMTQSTKIFHASKVALDAFQIHEIMPDMVIGMDILQHSHLYVAYNSARIYVSAAGDGEALAAMPVKTTWINANPR